VSEPDEVTFRVLVRAYGQCEPPRWRAISDLLQEMDVKYSIKPSVLLYNDLLEICARTRDQVPPPSAPCLFFKGCKGLESLD
jgi:hypothetical protein